jgi:hypothetical protein
MTMPVRDLFPGCSVSVELMEERWLVCLVPQEGGILAARTYPALLDAVYEWMLMLIDTTELTDDDGVAQREAQRLLREVLAHVRIGEDCAALLSPEQIGQRDLLREWFERQMGEGR